MIRSEPSSFNYSYSRANTESLLGSVGKTCCTRHWWDEDVIAFEAELKALNDPVGDTADAGAAISAFLAKRKEGVTAITEVSFISADVEHVQLSSTPACPQLCKVGERPQYRS